MTNDNGEFEYEFKFYVTVEGGMDFRAMLMKRKVKQKKIVQKVIEWIEVFFLSYSKVIFQTHVDLKIKQINKRIYDMYVYCILYSCFS